LFQDRRSGVGLLLISPLAGGDLMALLMKLDTLSSDTTRFYIAETVLALECIHALNYVHRYAPDYAGWDTRAGMRCRVGYLAEWTAAV
jgi:hypothetical protein